MCVDEKMVNPSWAPNCRESLFFISGILRSLRHKQLRFDDIIFHTHQSMFHSIYCLLLFVGFHKMVSLIGAISSCFDLAEYAGYFIN
jgi:hypothetical protein